MNQSRADTIAAPMLPAIVSFSGFVRMQPAIGEAFNPDEILFLMAAREPSLAEVWRHSLSHAHPPGNFLALHLMLGVSDSPDWLRLLSVLSGVLCVWLVYRLVRRLAGVWAGLLAALFAGYAPNLALVSGTCRNYSPASVFILLLTIEAVAFAQEPTRRRAAFAGVFACFALAWHYAAVVPILAAGIVALGSAWKRGFSPKMAGWYVLGQIPCALLFAIFYATHLSKLDPAVIATANDVMKLDRAVPAAAPFFPFIQLCRFLFTAWFGKASFVICALGGIAMVLTRRRLAALALGAPLILAWCFAAAGVLPLGATRQSSLMFPFVFGAFAVALTNSKASWLAARDSLGRLARSPGAELKAVWAGPPLIPRDEGAEPSDASPSRPLIYLGGIIAVGVWFMAWGTFSNLPPSRYSPDGEPLPPDQLEERAFAIDSTVREFPMEQFEIDQMKDASDKADPGDVVLMSHQTSIVFGYYLFPGPMEFAPDRPLRRERRGVKFIYSTEGYWDFTEETLGRAIEEVKRDFPEARRIWVPQVGWEMWREPHAEMLKRMYPEFEEDWKKSLPAGDYLVVANREEFEPPYPPPAQLP